MNKIKLTRLHQIGMILLVMLLFQTTSLTSKASTLEGLEKDANGQVLIHFEDEIKEEDVKTEFFGDVAQISINGAAVYPSKILSFNGGWVKKAFVYQFSPKQVRCRLSIDGHAEDIRNRFRLKLNARTIEVSLLPVQGAEKSVEADPKSKKAVGDDLDEDLLLDKITHSRAEAVNVSPSRQANSSLTLHSENHPQAEVNSSSPVLAGGKPLPSLGPFLMKLGLVLALLGGGVVLLRVYGSKMKKSKWAGLQTKIISKMTKKENRQIEVLTSTYLGPKKKITLVRVGGRLLALGVTEQSIQLITEIEESDQFNYDADRIQDEPQLRPSTQPVPRSQSFSDLLASEQGPSGLNSASHAENSTRTKIRNRLEDLKPL